MEIINTQWLGREEAIFVRETKKQIVVRTEAGLRKFWKSNGYELGYTRILRMGCEPDKLAKQTTDRS